jgi:chemotaxis protein CheZ
MADCSIRTEFTAERRRRLASPGCGAPAQPAAPAAFDEAETSIEALHWELSQLKDAIDHMKVEIAALRSDTAPPAAWDKATCELDAVVRATETATHTILEAAERIDSLLPVLSTTAPEADDGAAARIGEQVVRIFEACNFQDITGQRITKVVGAIKFIEGRIDRMIEILGGQGALCDVELPAEAVVDADAALLAGPQLESDPKISQDDIDRFFD